MAASFRPRFEKALRVGAGPAVVDGRLQSETAVDVADLAAPAVVRPTQAHYELFGPGDVQRLAAGAITRRSPAPGASDAEETKLALVEFSAPDLPWRYTPAAAAGAVLRPWLVLVVGHRAPGELTLRPDGRVTLGVTTQQKHVLAHSWQWAHVHEVDAVPIARLLGPLGLDADQDYVACVVPAFTAGGTDAWDGTAPVTLDCYDRWTFRTGPLGDFPDLAAKLHAADLAAIEADSGKPFGRAAVRYDPRVPGPAGAAPVVLPTAGALRLPPDPGGDPDPADDPPPPQVAAEVAALARRIVTPDGRGVVTAPRYDEPFVDPAAGAPAGWAAQLRTDPRLRGAAGLGLWTAIEWQDRISDAAATVAGDLTIAHDRIRHVALGVEASRSLWRRRVPLPAAPAGGAAAAERAAADRLAVLSPVLGRLPTTAGTTALAQIAGRTPQLGAALWSSAARRALRPGTARTALALPGAGGVPAALVAANACPPEGDDPTDLRRGDDPEGALKQAILDAAGGDDATAAKVLDRLGGQPSPGAVVAALRALAPGPDGRPDPDAVRRFLATKEFPQPDLPLREWLRWVREEAPPEPCTPLDLVALDAVVAAAVDPTVDRPPAVERVLSTLPGFGHIGPVEIEPELDLPLWSFLATRSPDWLLPGAGDLPPDSVVGLATNPPFVEALLVGANHQTTAELRWRNIPLVTRASPLRKFWQRPAGDYDITPLRTWPAADLGDAALSDGHGAEAVVAFRTSLFRRYPATVVYLYPADGPFTPPGEDQPLTLPDRKDPTFSGKIGDDITFFGFAVPPEQLATHWVVLEEPPTGYRFYETFQVPPPAPASPDDSSASFAYSRFALPVRVLIGPLL